MTQAITLIGFGEAGQTFAKAAGWEANARVFDVKTEDPTLRAAKLGDYEAAGVRGCASAADALRCSALVFSLVTADQATVAACIAAATIAPGTLFCDMNSVAPGTKRAAAEAITAAGARYVDVAIMAPVSPQRLAVPLLVSGPDAEAGATALSESGFTNITIAGARIGDASAVKMVRSVAVKGMEALAAECLIAAERAGVTDAVLASLGEEWAGRADHQLERMLTHGLRRAAEMEEVAATLDDLGVEPLMTGGTIARQRALGALGLQPVPEGLAAKLAALVERAAA
jgi:3-hydroxyisobutyrate dehydrogenase-like beta-hydroxyacid dehydrogenase